MAIARRTLSLGGGGDGLIVRIRMKRITIIIDGIERLQRGADIIKIDLLGVQGTTGCLNMIF
jgi:hypothetical protein